MTVPVDLAQRLAQSGLKPQPVDSHVHFTVAPNAVPDLAVRLVEQEGYEFATLVVEQTDEGFRLRYFFYAHDGAGLVELSTEAAEGEPFTAISDRVHAADWHEREAEDLFEIKFTGHPFLGDFVLHDTDWPEGVAPMRRDFDIRQGALERGRGDAWMPRRLLDEPGALLFPVGPVWGGYAESGLYLLETTGEQIRDLQTRLFYKYRGVEKIAEGRQPDSALLLAERFSGSSAFAHALAYCQALETITGTIVPARAAVLRVVLAELERLRYHAAVIAEIAGSTALAVGQALAQEIEEDLLRLTGTVCGHRYLFGLAAPGGLAFEPARERLAQLRAAIPPLAMRLQQLERLLTRSSSFLDRLEEMGTLPPELAQSFTAVGPVGRASGRKVDLRVQLPYAAYPNYLPDLATESEGDGYARLRVFFAEAHVSARLIATALDSLTDGPVRADWQPRAGHALGWAEAPAGAAFHWVRLDADGTIGRWRAGTPGFRNWHAFHRAFAGAAFQDFPIILASFGLSVAESDR
ncbi:MAG: NADH-quinone oxidoreductase subunit C [Nitrococcus sp.]|nr:NADH-quinone oxidoreductase subunit C [Nitrococcus sp.]